MIRNCRQCNTVYEVRAGREKTSFWCSRKCSYANRVYSAETLELMRVSHLGKSSKRKEFIMRKGYKYIYAPEHPNSHKQGYIAEHRLVMSNHIGRILKPKEVVHHLNEITTDNRIKNLALCESSGQHIKMYHPEAIEKAKQNNIGRKPANYNRIKKPCSYCTKTFETTLGVNGLTYCSMKCAGLAKKGKTPKDISGLLLGRGWNKGMKKTQYKTRVKTGTP